MLPRRQRLLDSEKEASACSRIAVIFFKLSPRRTATPSPWLAIRQAEHAQEALDDWRETTRYITTSIRIEIKTERLFETSKTHCSMCACSCVRAALAKSWVSRRFFHSSILEDQEFLSDSLLLLLPIASHQRVRHRRMHSTSEMAQLQQYHQSTCHPCSSTSASAETSCSWRITRLQMHFKPSICSRMCSRPSSRAMQMFPAEKSIPT